MAKAKKKPAKKAAAAPKKSVAKKKPVKKTTKPAPKKPAKKVAKKAAPKKAAAKAAVPKPKKEAPKAIKVAKAVKPAKEAPIPKARKSKAVPEVEAPESAAAEGTDEALLDEEPVEEVVLTDAEGRRYCRVKDCDQLATVDGYCRYHYLLFWKRIQIRKKILSEGKLERYIEELTARYPDKFLDMLRKDLRSEKEFLAAIQELEIDESGGENEFEDETQTYIDEVRGMGEGGTTREEEDF